MPELNYDDIVPSDNDPDLNALTNRAFNTLGCAMKTATKESTRVRAAATLLSFTRPKLKTVDINHHQQINITVISAFDKAKQKRLDDLERAQLALPGPVGNQERLANRGGLVIDAEFIEEKK